MNPIKKAEKIREKLNTITTNMTDEEAINNSVLFPQWNGNGVNYLIGERVLYNDILYSVIQNHKSQNDWSPNVAVSLFTRVLIPDPEVIPDWVQPDSTNPYMKGDKVRFEGEVYESLIDNNVWSPRDYPAGWKKIV